MLERARRETIEPLAPLYWAFLGASIVYLTGFLVLKTSGRPDVFSALEGVSVLAVAVAGSILPILAGSVLTLFFAERRFNRLQRPHGSQ